MDIIELLSKAFIVINFIVYIFKNNKNPNKNNVVLKTYYFLKKSEKEKINEIDSKTNSSDLTNNSIVTKKY